MNFIAQLGEILKERDTEDWITIARSVGIAVAAVRPLEDAMEDPAVRDTGFVVEYDHPDMGRLQGPGSLVKIDGQAGVIPQPAPRLGRDTAEVLAEVGYSSAEIEALIASRVAITS